MRKCTGEKLQDCWDCDKYYTSHSEHYSAEYDRDVTELSCSCGGDRVFDSIGNDITKG